MKKARTMKRDAVQENAHILVIWFANSNFFISNQRYLEKLYCEKKYRNSEMQSLRYKENRQGALERREEQTSATLYRKILISWASGFGILIFLYQIKGN